MEQNPYDPPAVPSEDASGKVPIWLILLRAMLVVLMPLLLMGAAIVALVMLLLFLNRLEFLT